MKKATMAGVASLRWMAGIISGLTGATMLIVPHQFSNSSYVLAAPHLEWWGVAFLLSGSGLLAAGVLQPRKPVLIALHLFVGGTWLFLALGFLLSRSWVAVPTWAVFGLGLAVAPFLREQDPNLAAPSKPGILSLLGGLTATSLGLTISFMIINNQFGNPVYAQIRVGLMYLGTGLIITGPLLLSSALPRVARLRPIYLGGHLLAGGLFLVFGVGLSLQVRAWSGIALYGGIGLSLALAPVLQDRLRTTAPNSLSVRMSVFVSVALTVSLVLAVTLATNYAVGRAASLSEEEVRSLRELTLGVLLLSLAVAVAAITYTARWVATPLHELADAASKLTGGDSTTVLPKSGVQEVQDLVASFGEMRVRLVAREIENARLYEQQERLAVVEERQRLSRDLHDSVTQEIFGVTLYGEAIADQLAAGNVDRASEFLSKLRTTAQESLREMRLLVFELRPPVLEQEGLAAAILARLDSVETRGGLKVRFEADELPRMPNLVEQELHRIAQEALNNVLKHSGARRVEVSLRLDEGRVVLEIRDDGRGYDVESARTKGGMGLQGMEERASRLGGVLRVESTVGRGSRVTVEVPAGTTEDDATGRQGMSELSSEANQRK